MTVYRHKNPSKTDSVQQVLYERRVLTFVTAFSILGAAVWMAAVATDYWIIVIPKTVNMTINADGYLKGSFLWSHSGLWRKCDYFGSPEDPSERHHHRCEFGSDKAIFKAEITVCAIVAALLIMATGFSLYSLKHPRYTYKRVSAALHIFTCCLLVVLIELVKSVGHLDRHEMHVERNLHPSLENSNVMYGYSYMLAWCSWMISLISGIAFLVGSRKRKLMPHDYEQNLK